MKRFTLLLVLIFASLSAVAQQQYVGRFDAAGAFSYLAEPKINLTERGLNLQGGVNANRWLALGADYSIFWGHSTLFPRQLTVEKQLQLAPLAAAFPGQPIFVPFDSKTWSFAAGPQFNIRKLSSVTFFVRPVLGVMHETVTAKPVTLVGTLATQGLLSGGNQKTDTATFYGFGGGMDFNVTKHMALRTQADFVHVFLFEGTLRESRNAARVSVGPTFRFGGNVR